jgi:hypothetical protein
MRFVQKIERLHKPDYKLRETRDLKAQLAPPVFLQRRFQQAYIDA